MREQRSPPTVRVLLPEALVSLFPGSARQVTLEAATVGEVMAALDARWPGMRDRLCDQAPGIRRHIRVFVGEQRAGLGTTLSPGAEVLIMTAISGG